MQSVAKNWKQQSLKFQLSNQQTLDCKVRGDEKNEKQESSQRLISKIDVKIAINQSVNEF